MTVVSYLACAGIDLVRGNAIKFFTVVLLTLLSLVAFAGTGHVNWPSDWRWASATWPEAS